MRRLHRAAAPMQDFLTDLQRMDRLDSSRIADSTVREEKKQGRSSISTGCPGGPGALRCASSSYFCATALLATPPPADFTQTVVGPSVVVPRNAQVPPLTGVVAMRAPVHAPPTAGPLWISTFAAKVPLASRVVVPSTRSSPLATASSARLIATVSVAPAGGGAGAAAFTT